MPQETIRKLLGKPGPRALVVGVHTGEEAAPLIEAGWEVTGVDILPPYRSGYEHVRTRFEDYEPAEPFDIAFSSHVLEHMEDVGATLERFAAVIRPGGWMGVVVPGYPQEEFFVGHYTLWTPALLLYNLVANGWDCRAAEYRTTPDRKHIAAVVPNRRIPGMPSSMVKGWDAWERLKTYLPVEFTHRMNAWLPDRWTT